VGKICSKKRNVVARNQFDQLTGPVLRVDFDIFESVSDNDI